MKKTKKAIILGAGPTINYGVEVVRLNWDVTIIEKQNISGGLCRSWKWKDYIVDTGPHIFHTPDKLLEKFWKKNFGDLLIEGKFRCKNVKGEKFNQYYDYPLSIEGLNKFDKKLKEKIKKELKFCNKKDQRFKAKNYKEYIKFFCWAYFKKDVFEKYQENLKLIQKNDTRLGPQ